MTQDDATVTPLEQTPPGLAPTATTRERIEALLAAGLPPARLREALGGVSEATIRNWMSQDASVPREPATRALDDLRAAMVALRQVGMDNERAVAWLTSRNLDGWLAGARPIEVIASDPLAVLAAIEELLDLKESSERGGQLVYLRVRPTKPSPAEHGKRRRRGGASRVR